MGGKACGVLLVDEFGFGPGGDVVVRREGQPSADRILHLGTRTRPVGASPKRGPRLAAGESTVSSRTVPSQSHRWTEMDAGRGTAVRLRMADVDSMSTGDYTDTHTQKKKKTKKENKKSRCIKLFGIVQAMWESTSPVVGSCGYTVTILGDVGLVAWP